MNTMTGALPITLGVQILRFKQSVSLMEDETSDDRSKPLFPPAIFANAAFIASPAFGSDGWIAVLPYFWQSRGWAHGCGSSGFRNRSALAKGTPLKVAKEESHEKPTTAP